MKNNINQNTHVGASFSLRNKIARTVWNIFYVLFFRYSLRPFHAYRRVVLKLFGAKIGKGVHVYPSVKIWAPWNLELGDYCGIGDEVNLYSQGKIKIGSYSVVSQNSTLCTGTHDYENFGFRLITKQITVESFVWIAAEVFIHPGVTIGEGCIIGARSVVINDMEGNAICSGFPCIKIKSIQRNK